MAILGAILEQQTGQVKDTGTGEKSAEIYVSKKITNAFAIRLVIRSRGNKGRLEFGPHYGQDRDTGYRLAYNAGAANGLEVLRLSRSGSAVVEIFKKPLSLSDGTLHTIQWTRDEQGEMVVSLNNQELLKIGDRRYSDAFDGFTIVNKGGDYTLRKVEIFGGEQGK